MNSPPRAQNGGGQASDFRSGRNGKPNFTRPSGLQRGREMPREVQISKALSKLLRHGAHDIELKLDAEGYARVDEVMKWQRLKSLDITFTELQQVVNQDLKKRYSMKPDLALEMPSDPNHSQPSQWLIRANQGHTIAADLSGLLSPITLEAGNVPDTVIHGTYFAFYKSIIESGGLNRMTRNHIHFCTKLTNGREYGVSGMRNDAEILIYVDISASLADGIPWWLSENGVVLTAGDERGYLPVKYFKKVVDKKGELGPLWENGVEVAQLPRHLEAQKPPIGKKLQVNRNVRRSKHQDRYKVYQQDKDPLQLSENT